jgi:hypothetical protein
MGVIGTLVEIVHIRVFYLTVDELQFRRKKNKISAGLNIRTLDYQSYTLPKAVSETTNAKSRA